MGQWCRDGIAINEQDLGDLAAGDGETLCEFAGRHFRLTAETIERQPEHPAAPGAAAAVLTLRQIDRPQAADAIYLVEFADAGLLDSSRCEASQYGQLADAMKIADRSARHYVCAELFRRAQDLIGGGRAA